MKTKTKHTYQQFIAALVLAVATSLQAQTLSGNFSNTRMDLSNMKPDQWTSLSFNSSSGATIGIAAKKAKAGIVEIDRYNEVTSEGAGVFAGTKEKKWPMAPVFLVTRTKSSDGNVYKDTGISATCTNLYYEGTVSDKVIYVLKPDGTTNWFHVAKPSLGAFEKYAEKQDPTAEPFQADTDFSSGQINSKKYGKVEVLIVSSTDWARLVFIVDEERLNKKAADKQ